MKHSRLKHISGWEWAGNGVMILLSLLAVIPFILLIISSFTAEDAALKNGYSFFPEAWSLSAYTYLLSNVGTIGHAYLITFIVTTVGTITSLAVMSTFGYALSRKGLPGRSVLSFLVTFTMLFNGGACATYIIYSQIVHVNNTIFALLLPGLLANGFSIMMFRSFFESSVPGALLEAAEIDGAGELTTFVKIVVPLSLPIFATLGLNQALLYWNDWTNSMYYISARNTNLLSIMAYLNTVNENIRFLQSNSQVAAGLNPSAFPSTTIRMAIAVIAVLPILAAYPFFQKAYVRGIMVGAVKE